MLWISSVVPPKLVTVMGWVEVVPTFCVKLKVEGEKLIAEGRGLGNGIGVRPNT